MKKIIVISSIALYTAINLMALTSASSDNKNKPVKNIKSKFTQPAVGTNPYTYSPQLFTAENSVTGRYWAGNKKYPAKAYVENEEYTNILVIKKEQVDLKAKKKLRKNKIYLGFYINSVTNQTYYLYGIKKNAAPVDNNPDADVLTVIAIKEDYGMGE